MNVNELRLPVSRILLALLLVSAVSLQGCRWFRRGDKADERTVQTPAEYTPQAAAPTESNVPPPSAPVTAPRPTGLRPAEMFLVIYFDFDQSAIRPDQLERMESNLKYLRDNPDAKILIEGHCDERGTTEYNFALGERRARSVADYFSRSGISAARIQVLSKGEEEPVDPGHTEAAWSKNRRAEFKFFD
jgi:peptidoglycan-associated lipoprotein